MISRRFFVPLSLFLIAAGAAPAAQRAKNVILFIGDAAGIPTLNAGSIDAYGEPARLFVQRMPNLALSDTSSSTHWVTDSAAGMSAIVTGQKTRNGVLSQMPAEPGVDGEAVKTILEYAEERGLSTGVISNSPMHDATPAACYAHVNSRSKKGEIFVQAINPRFGDGVDLILGPGRTSILDATAAMGVNVSAELERRGYYFSDSLDSIPANARRAVILNDDPEFDIEKATRLAIRILSKNPKGFFLMVESDLHLDKIKRGLDRVPKFDRLIEDTVKQNRSNSLILFTADHSFDLRVTGGAKGAPLYTQDETGKAVPAKSILINGRHSGEQVLVAADGPGSERVRGFIANTDLFKIMMAAYGWTPSPAPAAAPAVAVTE